MHAVMPGWAAVVVLEEDRWQAVMPMRICYKYGIGYALQPTFSQYLGVLFAPMAGKNNRIVHKKREILQVLIAAIPTEIRLFSYNFSPAFDYFLPFEHTTAQKALPQRKYPQNRPSDFRKSDLARGIWRLTWIPGDVINTLDSYSRL